MGDLATSQPLSQFLIISLSLSPSTSPSLSFYLSLFLFSSHLELGGKTLGGFEQSSGMISLIYQP